MCAESPLQSPPQAMDCKIRPIDILCGLEAAITYSAAAQDRPEPTDSVACADETATCPSDPRTRTAGVPEELGRAIESIGARAKAQRPRPYSPQRVFRRAMPATSIRFAYLPGYQQEGESLLHLQAGAIQVVHARPSWRRPSPPIDRIFKCPSRAEWGVASESSSPRSPSCSREHRRGHMRHVRR